MSTNRFANLDVPKSDDDEDGNPYHQTVTLVQFNNSHQEWINENSSLAARGFARFDSNITKEGDIIFTFSQFNMRTDRHDEYTLTIELHYTVRHLLKTMYQKGQSDLLKDIKKVLRIKDG